MRPAAAMRWLVLSRAGDARSRRARIMSVWQSSVVNNSKSAACGGQGSFVEETSCQRAKCDRPGRECADAGAVHCSHELPNLLLHWTRRLKPQPLRRLAFDILCDILTAKRKNLQLRDSGERPITSLMPVRQTPLWTVRQVGWQ